MNHYNDSIAKNYEFDRENEEHWHLENEFIFSNTLKFRGCRVLDVPVGTGRFLNYYEKQGVAEVVGLDISVSMLAEAHGKHLGNTAIILEQGDALSIAYPDEYFDAVICFRLVHLIPANSRVALLKELLRVGRELVLQVYINKKYNILQRMVARFRLLYSKKVSKPWDSIPSYPLYKEELMSIFSLTGVKVLSMKKLCEYCGNDVVVYILTKK